jgi:CubicO group peptidase (beta-lactamase class C family)
MFRLLAGFVCLFVALAVGAAEMPVAEIERIAREEMQRLQLPALQIAIAKNDRIVYSAAFGLADLEQQVKATPQTRFRTASVAKSMTATAVLQLAEEKKIDLDAPIATWCPAFAHKVTARQLLAHTSGVRHYQKPGESGGTQHHFSIGDSLALFKDDPLLFEPGTKFGYSTYAYSVLGCAIEGAAKTSYDELMAARVFGPAGMTSTGPDHHYLIVPHRAAFYMALSEGEWNALPPTAKKIARPGMVFNASFHDTSMKRAGGGLLSTAEDLARFAMAFMQGKLVSQESVNAAWTIQKTADGADAVSSHGAFGLGWIIRKRGDLREIYTSGGQVGARATMRIIPEKRLVVAMMTNLQNADIIPLEERMLDALAVP